MEFFLGAFERDWERRRAALLHELQLGRGEHHEWEWRRKGGAAFPDETQGGGRLSFRRRDVELQRSIRQRIIAVAHGSQPAVVKLASYGGGVRVAAMLSYTSRNGELAVETEKGEQITGKAALSQLRTQWEHLFDNRASSRDIGLFQVAVNTKTQENDRDQIFRHVLRAAFGERRFVYAIEDVDGTHLRVHGVLLLRGADGERLSGDAKAAAIAQERFDRSKIGSVVQARILFRGHGNGVAFALSRVREMVERFDGQVRDDRGTSIATFERAGGLVQRHWRRQMQSRKGRDVMHLIVSARAGTDPTAFRDAVREFLGDQFAGHRYAYAMHDPAGDPKGMAQGGKRPHIHAHAIVTMRSETGERIETSPQVFRAWRSLMAEKARQRGINMELTDRREFASAPAYTRTQVRPVSYAGRTEHEGTSQSARERYLAKRSNIPDAALSSRSAQYAAAAAQVWREVARDSSVRKVAEFAEDHLERIRAALRVSQIHATAVYRRRPDTNEAKGHLSRELFGGDEAAMHAMTRAELEAYEKRVEAILADIERSVGPGERARFHEITEAAREVMSIRRENLRFSEQQPVAGDVGRGNPGAPRDVSTSAEADPQDGRTPPKSTHEPVSGKAALDRSHELPRDERLGSARQARDRPGWIAAERMNEAGQPAAERPSGIPERCASQTDASQRSPEHLRELEPQLEQRHMRDRDERER
ncbi:conjugal transfer protein TraA [Mesorhizobium sp. BR1-1-13]|uniref:relaxase/mobilization nuclease domain-containing protein n=1 Tax=Mesorhizobium sp. BR1-1-13 TaxID=2876656 RepID=UPI001CD08760|nr:conjugal transfer protein TraA [Mesorhizobium sp. BR1-1-13]MBZ9942162.1 conjugal transfer protein TraA [Mesorhizobium sp. BR1-1-13]